MIKLAVTVDGHHFSRRDLHKCAQSGVQTARFEHSSKLEKVYLQELQFARAVDVIKNGPHLQQIHKVHYQ